MSTDTDALLESSFHSFLILLVRRYTLPTSVENEDKFEMARKLRGLLFTVKKEIKR
jgi:hypothetical protein